MLMLKNLAKQSLRKIKNTISCELYIEGRNFYFLFSIIYSASYIWIFFVPADFWDDLTVRNNPDIIKMGYEAGLPLAGYFINYLYSFQNHELIAHSMIFVFYFISYLFLRQFLLLLAILPKSQINSITLITAVLPVFQSRFMQASIYYSFSLLSFCLASVFLVLSYKKRKLLLRLFSYIFFFAAFITASFLVMYGFILLLVFITIYLKQSKVIVKPTIQILLKSITVFLRRLPESIFLPIVFFVFKTKFFPVSNAFINYNIVTTDNLYTGLKEVLFQSLDALSILNGNGTSWNFVFLAIAIFIFSVSLISFFTNPNEKDSQQRNDKSNLVGLLVSFFGVCFAIFPYSVMSRQVIPFDFDDRNQLTMIVVTGAFLFFAFNLVIRKSLHWLVLPILLIWGMANNLTTYAAVIIDGHTQNSFVMELSSNEVISKNTTFIVDVHNWPNLSRRRTYSTAQLNCLMKDAFGDETRFASVLSSIPFDWEHEFVGMNIYRNTGSCFRDYKGGVPMMIVVSPGSRNIDFLKACEMSFLRLFDSEEYRMQLSNLVKLKVFPLPSGLLISNPPLKF